MKTIEQEIKEVYDWYDAQMRSDRIRFERRGDPGMITREQLNKATARWNAEVVERIRRLLH